MEIAQQGTPQSFKVNFEINDIKFIELSIDSNRISAIGKSWTKFELLISFIGAAWMEKWRRFGYSLLALGILLILSGLPFGFSMYFGINPLTFLFMGLGILLIVIWALVKKEALMLFTPGGQFKIEGSAGFIESLWSRISQIQHERDV